MKCTVTYSCGHKGEVQVFGSAKERERKFWWYENKATCPDCYKAQKQKEAAEATSGLPQLEGSEKQVKWATDIRADFAKAMQERIPDTDDGKAALTALGATMAKLTQAKWWIDNRNNIQQAINELYQATLEEMGVI